MEPDCCARSKRAPEVVTPGEKGGALTRPPPGEQGNQQPIRRSQRLLGKPTLPPERDTARIRRIIFVLGGLLEEDLTEWDRMLYEFHTDGVLQDGLDVLRAICHLFQHALFKRTIIRSVFRSCIRVFVQCICQSSCQAPFGLSFNPSFNPAFDP